jgi:hypothetical protein
MIAPSPKANRHPNSAGTSSGLSSGTVISDPAAAPTQNDPLIARAMRPRYFAGISSSIA